MLVLGIESTCDEASAAIVENGRIIHSNIIASQSKLHQRFNGVYPEYASRKHVEILLPVIQKALAKAGAAPKDLDLIAVAQKPGLIGSLLVGMNTAKSLSMAWNIPYISVNHIQAHIYAAMMDCDPPKFPALGVVISGGHTILFKMRGIDEYEKLSSTIDDSIGEAFDKAATILGLPYPGGPEIEKLAEDGDISVFPMQPCKIKNNPLAFSFSGLKTKILYLAKGLNANKHSPLIIGEKEKKHLAASFQHAALSDIVEKSLQACKISGFQHIYLGGGVTNNKYLRTLFEQKSPSTIAIHHPPPGLSLDNGAMIAGLGYHLFQKNPQSDPYDMEVVSTGGI